MSSPIVFSLTAAQYRALQCLAGGKAGDVPERTLSQLVIKGLVSNSEGWALTPAGEAAALLVARLSEASPISGSSGAGEGGAAVIPGNSRFLSPEKGSLGIYAKSVNRKAQKPAKTRDSRPNVSGLAQRLLQAGGYVVGRPQPGMDTICTLSPEDWELVVAHDAQDTVLRQAERQGEAGVRSLLSELRAMPAHQDRGAGS